MAVAARHARAASSYAALAEDVGAGDVTTEATVDADAVGHRRARCSRSPASSAGSTPRRPSSARSTRTIEFERLVGGGTRSVEAGRRRARERLAARDPHRRAHRAQPPRPALRHRDADAALRRRRRRAPASRSSTRARRRPACARSRSTRSPPAAAATTASGSTTASSIKDNHLRAAGSIARRGRARCATRPDLPIEVECDTLEQVARGARRGRRRDPPRQHEPRRRCARAVALAGGRARLEASGGVTLETVRAIAETGVDVISVGALTHSARSLDVSLELT